MRWIGGQVARINIREACGPDLPAGARGCAGQAAEVINAGYAGL
jgi:hypothetical protein